MKCLLWLVCWVTLFGNTAHAAVIEWEDPVSGDFDNSANWDPNTVPGAADDAVFNEAGTYNVTFTQDEFSQELIVSAGSVSFLSDSAANWAYTISTDGDDVDEDVEIDGTLVVGATGTPVQLGGADAILAVGTASSSSVGELTVSGDGSALTMLGTSRAHPIGGRGGQGTLTLQNSGVAEFGDATLDIGVSSFNATQGFLTIQSGGRLFTNDLNIATNTTGAVGMATIDGAASDATIADQAIVGSSSGGAGSLTITGDGTLNVGGTTTINATGTVNAGLTGEGTFNASGPVNVDGGTLNVGDADEFQLAGGQVLNASNDGQVVFSNSYSINNTTFEFNSGADLDVGNNLDVGFNSDGTLLAEGIGSTVTATGSSFIGGNGASGDVTFRDQAIGNLRDIDIADTLNNATVGNLSVRNDGTFGAALNTESIFISTNGGGDTGTVTVDGFGSTLTQTGAAILAVGSATGSGSATINVQNGGTFTTGTGATGINATGTINVGLSGQGTFNANGPVIINGGTLNIDGGTDFQLATGQTLTASNGGQANFGFYLIEDGTTFDINSTAVLTVDALGIGLSGGDGTLVVDGAGSSVTVTNSSSMGSAGNTADVTIRNQASGIFRGTSIAGSTVSGTTGNLTVETGAAVTTDNLSIATSGGDATATITINGAGSTLTQTGASLLTLGSNNGTGTARINVQNGGTLTTGTGTTRVFATGRVSLSGGALNATTIEHTSGGLFSFTGGTLSVETFDGDLTNQGGTLSPGASPGSTTIIGDYIQQTGAALEIEIGGDLQGTEFDFVNVTGMANIDGDLQLALINGFTPDATDEFIILSSDVLVGGFDNVVNGGRLDIASGLGSFEVTLDFPNDLIMLSNYLAEFTADFDEDGDVDNADLGLWEAAYGSTDVGDANDDGRSDGLDFLIWQEQYTGTLGGIAVVAVVPEPGGIVSCFTLLTSSWLLRPRKRARR